MKTKTINLYEFNELNTEAQEKAISDQIDFEVKTMTEESPYYTYALQMEAMKTPWFLGQVLYQEEKDSIIDNLKYSDFTFTSDGRMENL